MLAMSVHRNMETTLSFGDVLVLGQLLIFLPDLPWGLGALNNLPALLLQTLLPEAVVDGSLARVDQNCNEKTPTR